MSEATHPSGAAELDLDLSGRQLGGYLLKKRLGAGGMAEVYLAEQRSLRRQVAIKTLKRELARDETYVHRFHMEAQAAAALVHANIVQIHEVGCDDGVHYIAQEYVAGVNLRELLAKRGTLDARLAVSILRQVAAALAKAAEQGIVHRDIKPENILINKAGEVKVADFGLARIVADGQSLNLTQTGMTMGTPLYMSPEQVEGKTLDPRSDVYSLGVTAYHMLTGHPPFRGETALAVAVQHVRNEPEPLQQAKPELPPELCRIVHKMLAKKLDERYANARDLLRDLRGIGQGAPGADGPVAVTMPTQAISIGTPQLGAIEATQRLSALMKTQSLAMQRQRSWRWKAAAIVGGAFCLGAGTALVRPQPFLLDASSASADKSAVERKPNALDQYLYAVQLGSVAGWKSVADYFPSDKKYVPRAQQQLARLYLQQDNYDAALALFDQFAHYDTVERAYRAFGLAGKCVVYSLEERPKESADAATQLFTLAGGVGPANLEKLLDPQMTRFVGVAMKKNRQALNKETAAEWDKWLETHFQSDTPGTTSP